MAKNKKHYFVDLFAGCGGLSLGLEKAGFTPLLFSELNQSAAKTYRANREDEYEFRSIDEFLSGNHKPPREKKLIIEAGDIVSDLSDEKLNSLINHYSQKEPSFNVDLVCGGPPCQGFSMINHRRTETHLNNNKQDIPSNFLFKEMIRVIEAFKPKIFLFENVEGIRRSYWKIGSEPTKIFADVMAEFRKVCGSDYNVQDASIKSREYAVPQRRPRTLIVGVRKDIIVEPRVVGQERKVIDNQLYLGRIEEPEAISRGFLPPAVDSPVPPWPNLSDVLDDLIEPIDKVQMLVARDKGESSARRYPKNKMPGQSYTEIEKWYRASKDEWFGRKPEPHQRYLKKVTDHEYSRHSEKTLSRFKILMENNGEIPPEYKVLKTNKFAQRLLFPEWLDKKNGPNITVTSLPDDFVHYEQPRILTVREWARLQTFPDWYVFRGPRTTGGRRRAGTPSKDNWDREVPRYTQIGNAVPVRLAFALGNHFLGKFV